MSLLQLGNRLVDTRPLAFQVADLRPDKVAIQRESVALFAGRPAHEFPNLTEREPEPFSF